MISCQLVKKTCFGACFATICDWRWSLNSPSKRASFRPSRITFCQQELQLLACNCNQGARDQGVNVRLSCMNCLVFPEVWGTAVTLTWSWSSFRGTWIGNWTCPFQMKMPQHSCTSHVVYFIVLSPQWRQSVMSYDTAYMWFGLDSWFFIRATPKKMKPKCDTKVKKNQSQCFTVAM